MQGTNALSTFWIEMWACSGVDLDKVKYRSISYSYRKEKHDTLIAQTSKTATVPTAMPRALPTLIYMYFVSGATGKHRSACGTID